MAPLAPIEVTEHAPFRKESPVTLPKLIKLKHPIRLEANGRRVKVIRVEPALLEAAQRLAAGGGTDVTSAWVDLVFTDPTGVRRRLPVDLASGAAPGCLHAVAERYHLASGDVEAYFLELNRVALEELLSELTQRVAARASTKRHASVQGSEWPWTS
jgi:hypothetical protein